MRGELTPQVSYIGASYTGYTPTGPSQTLELHKEPLSTARSPAHCTCFTSPFKLSSHAPLVEFESLRSEAMRVSVHLANKPKQ